MTDLASSSSEPGRPERRVAINSGLLLAAFGFQALVSIIIVGLLARYLGQAGLGRYAYVVSFIELFLAFVDLGLNRILTREISRHKALADRYASAAWTLRLTLSVGAMIVVGVAAVASGDRQLWLAIMVYYASQVLWLLGDIFNGVFHGFQRMEYQFWTLNASQVLLLALTLGVMWLNLGLIAIFTARLIANAIKLVWVWRISDRRFARVHMLWGIFPALAAAVTALPQALTSLRRSRRTVHLTAHAQVGAAIDAQGQRMGQRWQDARLTWRMLVEALPVGISLLLRSYIWRAGVVLTVLWLGQAQGDLVNGVLYGPLRAIQQLRIVPAAFAAAVLPVLSNRAAGRMAEFDSAFAKSIKLFTAISLLIALAATFLADPLVLLLLGGGIDLQTAAAILALLGWVIVLYFPNWLYGVALVALGKQKLETLGLVIGLIVGYLVARWAIPAQQALGVAYAIMAAEGAIFVIGTAVMWQHFHWRTLGPALLKLVVASALAGGVFLAGNLAWTALAAAGLAPTGPLGAIIELTIVGGLGFVAFSAALFLLRTFDADEIAGIRAMLGLRPNRS